MEQLSRRQFLTQAGLATGAVLLGGCGQQRPDTIAPANTEALLLPDSFNESANATEPAVQIGRVQLNPIPLPPKSWEDGCFVRSSLVDFNGMSLNYDDGPSPYNTDPILRTLAKYGIKGTFYIIGVNALAWPEILQRIVDEGHEIGNHSYYHSPYEASALASQIERNQNTIFGLVGVRPVSNRAPGLTRGLPILNECKRLGMYEVHTTIDSGDWTSERIPSYKIAQNVLGPLHPGAFPLQHDGGNSRPTPDAQEQIITTAFGRGYRFHTVTDLINLGRPLPGNNSYSLEQLNGQRVESEIPIIEPLVQNGVACNYSPKAELEKRLKDVSLKRAERSRIVEVLADIEAMEKAA